MLTDYLLVCSSSYFRENTVQCLRLFFKKESLQKDHVECEKSCIMNASTYKILILIKNVKRKSFTEVREKMSIFLLASHISSIKSQVYVTTESLHPLFRRSNRMTSLCFCMSQKNLKPSCCFSTALNTLRLSKEYKQSIISTQHILPNDGFSACWLKTKS